MVVIERMVVDICGPQTDARPALNTSSPELQWCSSHIPSSFAWASPHKHTPTVDLPPILW